MIRRGSDFPRLAKTMGINPATKRSRLMADQSGLGYDGLKREFDDAAASFNQAVLELRSRTAPRRG